MIAVTMTHQERLTALLHLYPAARLPEDVAFSADGTTGPVLTRWNLPGEPPTEAQLLAALPAAQARLTLRRYMRDTQTMIDERLQMHSRAVAWGNTTAADEIKRELNEDLKPYMEDLKNAANSA